MRPVLFIDWFGLCWFHQAVVPSKSGVGKANRTSTPSHCFGRNVSEYCPIEAPVGDLESDGRALEARFRTWVEFAYPTERYIARTFLEKSKKPGKKSVRLGPKWASKVFMSMIGHG